MPANDLAETTQPRPGTPVDATPARSVPWSARLRVWATPPHITLSVIVALATVLRFYRFASVPVGFNQDEAAAAYETFSLITNGTDRWGNRFPVYFPAFGSGQNVLLSYLNIPFVMIFGPTPFAVRIVPALLGVVTVLVAYLLVQRISTQRAGLLAALLVAICPWHMMMSRWSLESNLLPAVLIIAVWLLVKAYQSPDRRWLMVFSLVPMALAFYAYATAAFVLPIFLALFLAAHYKTVRAHVRTVAASIAVFGLVAAPFGLFLITNQILHRTPSVLRHLPFSVPLLPGSRLNELKQDDLAINNFHFVVDGFDDHRPWNVLSPYKPLGPIVLPLAALGLAIAIRRWRGGSHTIVLWLVAAVPLWLSVPLNVNRANVAYLPLLLLAALGADWIAGSMRTARAGRAVTAIVVSASLAYSSAFALEYFQHYNDTVRVPFNEGLDTALRQASHVAAPGEPIYVDEKISLLTYVYVLLNDGIEPREFRANSHTTLVGQIYVVHNYRQYHFWHTDAALASARSYVAILRDGDTRCADAEPLNRAGVFEVVRCHSVIPPDKPQ